MTPDIFERLVSAFGLVTRASSRKKLYAKKARRERRSDYSKILEAISESEAIQARRLLHSIKGKIDTSENYVATIFEDEMAETTELYCELLEMARSQGNRAVETALSQILAAEKRNRSFYIKSRQEIAIGGVKKLYVCSFCGFLATNSKPLNCPVCHAKQEAFQEI